MAVPLAFYAQFIASAVGADGLTVTWDVERITRSTGARAALVTGAATNITVGRRGLYGYLLSDSDLATYDYVATAITAGDADQKEIAAMWTEYSLPSVVQSADCGSAAVLAGTQGTITWGQQKIVAAVAGEGALDIYNSDAEGIGQYNHSKYGMRNAGTLYGMHNTGATACLNHGTTTGQTNLGDSTTGQLNNGGTQGQYNTGPLGQWNRGTAGDGQKNQGTTYGTENIGTTAAVSPLPAVAGDAMALTAGERTTLVAAVWAAAGRTLTSFGTLAADAATAVWAAGARTLTSFGTLVASIVNAVLDELIAGHLDAGSVGEAIAAASGGGTGTSSITVTVDDGSAPIDGALVELTATSAHTGVLASGYTDSLGQVTLLIDPGTYYVWVQHGRFNGTNPTTVVVP